MSAHAPQSFTITLKPNGSTFTCAIDGDILKAGLASGLSLRYSCRSGVCRTCRARLVEGQVDYGAVHPNYLSDADKDAGYLHLCCAKPLTDCTVEAEEIDLGQAPSRQFPVRVMTAQRLAPDVMQVVIGLPPNEPLQFLAGQYVEVLLADGMRRCYSIASAPLSEGLRQIELHIRHMPGGLFTDRVFGALKARDLLRVEAPQGFFRLDETSQKPMVMVASGTGFAPIKAMVEYSLQKGMTRPMHVYWGGRRRADLYMDSLASGWAQANSHITYTPVLSDATVDCHWTGRRGFVHQAVMQDHADLSAFQVYACGAPVMVDAARTDFGKQCGLPGDQFFADSFVSEADKARGLSTA
jgi:CDP-4-dehydro-6-deoxyglucose reductase, E3